MNGHFGSFALKIILGIYTVVPVSELKYEWPFYNCLRFNMNGHFGMPFCLIELRHSRGYIVSSSSRGIVELDIVSELKYVRHSVVIIFSIILFIMSTSSFVGVTITLFLK